MAAPKDELDGPLFRVRLAAETQIYDRKTGEWQNHSVSPGSQFTVVKQGNSIDLEIAQPALSWDDVPLRVLLQKALKALLRGIEDKP
ncbi:MAG TPA: hypothetical protein VKX49_12440 [Bryobacteraceae bacterium]|nr:hypothetical protein [Bryobacteraceae bacterium]